MSRHKKLQSATIKYESCTCMKQCEIPAISSELPIFSFNVWQWIDIQLGLHSVVLQMQPFLIKRVFCKSLMISMAVRVVEFSSGGYRIGKIFCIKINIPETNYWILRIGVMGRCQKVNFLCQKSLAGIFFNFFHWRISISKSLHFEVVKILWSNVP